MTIETMVREFRYDEIRLPDLGGHPNPANGGHLKTGQ